MILVLLSWIWVFWHSLSFGLAAREIIGRLERRGPEEASTWGLDYILLSGFLLIALIAAYLTVFFPIGTGVKLGFGFAALGLSLRYWQEIRELGIQCRLAIQSSGHWVKAVGLGILIFSLAACTDQISFIDTWLYHAQAIQWIQAFPVVPGLGNLHGRLAFNSHFFIPTALFSFGRSPEFFIYPLNSFFFLVLCCRLLWNAWTAYRKQDYFWGWFSILMLALLPYHLITLINSSSTDVISCLLVVYLFLIFFNRDGAFRPVEKFYLCGMLIFSAVTFKLSALFLAALLPFVLPAFRLAWLYRAAMIGVLFLLPFLYRNVVLSGYVLYPYPGLDLFSFDWEIPRPIAVFEKKLIAAWPKIPYSAKEQDAVGLSIEDGIAALKHEALVEAFRPEPVYWLKDWIREKGNLMKLLLVSNLLVVLLAAFALVKKQYSLAIWLGVSTLNLLFWFVQAPDPRFAFGFLFLGFSLCISYICTAYTNKFPLNWKWFLVAGFCLASGVLITKRSVLLSHQGLAENWIFPRACQEWPMQLMKLEKLSLWAPLSGDECYNVPLPCTPYPYPSLEMRGKRLAQGFRIPDDEVK